MTRSYQASMRKMSLGGITMNDLISIISSEDRLSFISFFEKLHLFSNKIAFKSYETEWTYANLVELIEKTGSVINLFSEKYICLKIEHPVLFCATLFSVILSGKVAVLGEIETCDNNEVTICDNDLHNITAESKKCTIWKSDADIEGTPCVIVKSSGTTSVSKKVMLSQKNLMTEIITLTELKLFTGDDIYLHILPFSHLFGLLGDLLLPLYVGAVVCFGNNNNIFDDMKCFNPTQMCLPPVALDSIIYLIDCSDCKSSVVGTSLNKIITGGADIKDTSVTILKRHGIDIIKAYGLTECSPCISVDFCEKRKHGSVGHILPCCDVKIINGEITVAGDTVMVGYWNDLESTSKVIKNGRLYTGDLGSLDSDDYLFISGRKTNLIVFDNGTKIVPEEVEKSILSIPEITECVVVDNGSGKHIRVDIYIVISKIEYESKISLCIHEILRKYCSTEYVGNTIISETPLKRNELGKIDRRFYRK